YSWMISINNVVVFSSTADGEEIQYEILRSNTVDQTVELSLRTTNLANCESNLTTKTIFIERAEDLNAGFTVSPVEQTLPSSTVTIVNTTNAGPWQYLWDFGDGETSADPFVSAHTYDTYGVYTITLQVSNNDCVDIIS